jgi:hypothetical protein
MFDRANCMSSKYQNDADGLLMYGFKLIFRIYYIEIIYMCIIPQTDPMILIFNADWKMYDS